MSKRKPNHWFYASTTQIDIMFNPCIIEHMSRLSIEIDPEHHRQIKTLATFEGMTIKDFILSRTLPQKALGKELDTTKKLLSSPENKERLMEAIEAPASESRVFETMDDLKDALGI